MPDPNPAATATLDTVKPGHHTTEFYLNLGLTLLMAAIATGVVPQTGELAKIAAFGVMAITNTIYMLSRASVKNAATTALAGPIVTLPDASPAVPVAAVAVKLAPLLALFVLGAALVTGGCGVSAETAVNTATSISSAADAAFLAYDHQHEADLLAASSTRIEFDAKLATYLKKRKRVDDTLLALRDAIDLARTAKDNKSIAAIAPAALAFEQSVTALKEDLQ